jgi:hypothetical protein
MPEHKEIVDKVKQKIGSIEEIGAEETAFLNNDPDYVAREVENMRRSLVSSVPVYILDRYNIPVSEQERIDITRNAFVTYQLNDYYGHDMRANADYMTGNRDRLLSNVEAFSGDRGINLSMQKQSADLVYAVSNSEKRNISAWRGSNEFSGTEGDIIDVSLLSFSHDEGVARGSFGKDKTLYHLTGESRGISVADDLGDYSGGRFSFEREYLTGGEFIVNSVEKSDGWTIVNITQDRAPVIIR